MRVVPYIHPHLHALELQPGQREQDNPLSEAYLSDLQRAGDVFTALDDDGRVLGIFGCLEVWKDRAQVWALLSWHSGPHLLRITRQVLRYLAAQPYRRIEAHVDANFHAGMKWMPMLGFERETINPMRSFTPDGRDCHLFALVR